jgi:AraC family transcriptional regulator of adaptative response/methylated-DNA-[protein]-cysteine methyltransferase
MTIKYSVADTCFGPATIASTELGICCVSFAGDPVSELTRRFRPTELINRTEALHQTVAELLSDWPASRAKAAELPLHLIGTEFQLAIWKALLTLKPGELTSYQAIAQQIGRPTAVRATGTAIGQNPVAVLVPCHRVLTSSGKIGGYRWGINLKTLLLEKEREL